MSQVPIHTPSHHPLVMPEAHGYAHRNRAHPRWEDTLKSEARTGLGAKLRELGGELQQQLTCGLSGDMPSNAWMTGPRLLGCGWRRARADP